uniref:Galactokinase n=1 Tax=mine drainage metagenome TaxID=410659 RepID=E6PX33_9ZZZZ
MSYRLAPIPGSVSLVIANTMVKHSIAGGEYGTRRAEVELACRILAGHRPEIRFLRDATVGDLDRWGEEIPLAARKRARHIITENTRTMEAAEALLRHDLATVGRLMYEAHESYSRDFEASCEEADTMVELAMEIPGLIGARLTGGGFGGCTVNLVEKERAREFAATLGERYLATTGITAQMHVCRAADGARRVL